MSAASASAEDLLEDEEPIEEDTNKKIPGYLYSRKVKWTFFIKDLRQRVFAISCCRDDTILAVKTMFREKTGIPENSFHLLCGTKRLGVDELAGSYPDGSRLLVVMDFR